MSKVNVTGSPKEEIRNPGSRVGDFLLSYPSHDKHLNWFLLVISNFNSHNITSILAPELRLRLQTGFYSLVTGFIAHPAGRTKDLLAGDQLVSCEGHTGRCNDEASFQPQASVLLLRGAIFSHRFYVR